MKYFYRIEATIFNRLLFKQPKGFRFEPKEHITFSYRSQFKTSKLVSSKHRLKPAVKSTLCQTFPSCYSLTWGATRRAAARDSTHTCMREHMCTRARSFQTPLHLMRKSTFFFFNLKIAETRMSPKIVLLIMMAVFTLVLHNAFKK